MKEYKNLTSEEREYVEFFYDDESYPIEDFYEDNFAKCDNCGEIIYVDDLVENDLLTWGGEMKICESCMDDGWGE